VSPSEHLGTTINRIDRIARIQHDLTESWKKSG
jgi:hypothetical protein